MGSPLPHMKYADAFAVRCVNSASAMSLMFASAVIRPRTPPVYPQQPTGLCELILNWHQASIFIITRNRELPPPDRALLAEAGRRRLTGKLQSDIHY